MRRMRAGGRLALLLLCSALGVLLLQHCSLSSHLQGGADEEAPQSSSTPRGAEDDLRSAHIRRLQLQISELQRKLRNIKVRNLPGGSTDLQQHRSSSRPTVPITNVISGTDLGNLRLEEYPCKMILKQQLLESETNHGNILNNEYEVVPFSHFTWSRVYPSELGLGKRVVEKPIGFRRKDLMAAFTTSLQHLNEEGNAHFSIDDFIEGVYRNVPGSGTHYELVFREHRNESSYQYRSVTLLRPFAPISVVRSAHLNTKELINVIVPLSGRLDTFRSFMDKLVRVILKHDRHIFMTVVYFGQVGLQEVRNIITNTSREANFKYIKLLTLNETFSRGKALQVGASHWHKGDVILFMCDVDVAFSVSFLNRCRLHAVAGKSVYFPVVFSLYNPMVVYPLMGKGIPEELDQLIISRDTGFWRDFGYGMTCQYRSDFLNVQGFDEDIVGWGGEDVLLYRKYVKSHLAVVRATDPGIFHLWHQKRCPSSLTSDQYTACLTSRALNEASHAHLGLVAFRSELLKDIEGNLGLKKSQGEV